jgi:putative transposase
MFDITGRMRKPPDVNRSKLTKRRLLMSVCQSLSHTTWDCKYHLVWIPKYRKKVIYDEIRKYLGEIVRERALHKESKVLEGHLKSDHIHMLVSIPPKYAVSPVVGYMKGKSAIHIARTYAGHKRNFVGQRIFRFNSWCG